MSFILPSINGYKIIRKIGEGQHSVALLATQEKFNRDVVIKVLKNITVNEQKQFLSETNKITQLNYPNIAMVFDADFYEDKNLVQVPYITMEYIQGDPLSISEGRIKENSLKKNLELFLDLVRAVDFAHQKDVVHGDLHPNNILLVPHKNSQIIKIIDFGLSGNTQADRNTDIAAIKFLLDKFFFFPNIPLIKNGLLSMLDLESMIAMLDYLINLKFYDQFVTNDYIYLETEHPTIETLTKTETNVMLDFVLMERTRDPKVAITNLYVSIFCFARDFRFSRGFEVEIAPLWHSDIQWRRLDDKYLITLLGRIASGEYGTFLLLLSLAEIYLNENNQGFLSTIDDAIFNDDFLDFIVRHLYEAKCIEFLYQNGFMLPNVKVGILRHYVRSRITPFLGKREVFDQGNGTFTTSEQYLDFRGLDIAFYNYVLQKFRLEQFNILDFPNKNSIKNMSYLLANIDLNLFIETGYIVILLRVFEKLFLDRPYIYGYKNEKIAMFEIIEIKENEVKVDITKIDITNELYNLKIIDSQNHSVLFLMQELHLDYLTEMYSCILLEKFFRLPVSQFYKCGNSNLVAIQTEGVYCFIQDKAIIHKTEHFDNFYEGFLSAYESSFLDINISRETIAKLFFESLKKSALFYSKQHIITQDPIDSLWFKRLESLDYDILSLTGLPVSMDQTKEEGIKRITDTAIKKAWSLLREYLNQEPLQSWNSPYFYGRNRMLG